MQFINLSSPFAISKHAGSNIAVIIINNDLNFFGFPYIVNKLKQYNNIITVANCSSSIGNSMLANKHNFNYIIVETNKDMLKKLNSLAKETKFFNSEKALKQYLQSNKK